MRKKIIQYARKYLSCDVIVKIADAPIAESVVIAQAALRQAVVESSYTIYSKAHQLNIENCNKERLSNINLAEMGDWRSVVQWCRNKAPQARSCIEKVRQEIEVDNVCVGFDEWEDFPESCRSHPKFDLVTSVFESPQHCHASFLRDALDALDSNEVNNGKVWASYRAHGVLTFSMIKAAIAAYRRHTKTSYDYYLRGGVSRELAREFAAEDMLYVWPR